MRKNAAKIQAWEWVAGPSLHPISLLCRGPVLQELAVGLWNLGLDLARLSLPPSPPSVFCW